MERSTLGASDEISFEVSQANEKMDNIISDGSFKNDSYKYDFHENEDSLVVQMQQHESPPHSPSGSALTNMFKVYSINNEEINGLININKHEYIVSNNKNNHICLVIEQGKISSIDISLNNNVEDEIDNKQMEVQISLTNTIKDSIDEKHLGVKISSNDNLQDDINESIAICDQEYYSCEESELQPLFDENYDNLSTQFQSNSNLDDNFVMVKKREQKCHHLQSNIPKQVSNEVEKTIVTPNPFVVLALQSEQKTSKRSRKRRIKKLHKDDILLKAI